MTYLSGTSQFLFSALMPLKVLNYIQAVCTLYSKLVNTTDWCFCSLETCVVFFAPFSHGCKNPLACDGHPVGWRKLILLGLFVLDQQATCVCFLVFFLYFFTFQTGRFYWCINMFYGRCDFTAYSHSFIWASFSPPPPPRHKRSTMCRTRHFGSDGSFFVKIWFMWMGQMFLFLILMYCILCTISHPPRLTSLSAMQLFNA